MTFVLIAPTAPPVLISATEVTSDSVKLTWNVPPLSEHNGLIRKYILKQIELNTGAVKYYNVTDTTYVATALHPYYQYNFSVAAVTVAPGPYSETITALTEQDGTFRFNNANVIIIINSIAPTAAPTEVSVIVNGSRGIYVSWNAPPANETNGIIVYYLVSVMELESLTEQEYETEQTSLAVNRLHPYYTFTVMVAAVTIDTGPYSIGYTVQTLADGRFN